MKTIAQIRDAAKAKILTAFAATPYPGDDSLVVDQSGFDPECNEIAREFRGKDWKDISVEMLLKYKEALPLFTPAAFRYYLPAYMIGCTDFYDQMDVALDSTLFNLTPPQTRSGWSWDFFWIRAQQFNESEKDAIKSFLELMAHCERADWASEGMEPPVDRAKSAFEFWTYLTQGRQPP